MENRALEDKLTPAARQLLDEMTDDYRAQLLLRAQESAAGLGSEVREISVHDLFRSYARTSSRSTRLPLARLDRILLLYAATGLLVGAGGIMAYVFRRSLTAGSPPEQVPLLIGLTGFSVALLTLLVAAFYRLRLKSAEIPVRSGFANRDMDAEYLARWVALEVMLRSLAVERFGESMARASISDLLQVLRRENFFSEEEIIELRELLGLRNRIAHGRGSVRPLELRRALRSIERLREKLSEGSESQPNHY